MAGLSEETKRLLELTTTATLTTQLFKRGFRNTFIQGVRRLTAAHAVMVGEAFTLRMIPAREDLDHPGMFGNRSHPQRRAIEECPPGAVLAIDCRKDIRGGCLGDILCARLLERGVAGVVTDGAMRDVPQIETLAIPVYAGGAAAPASFGIHHAVDLDQPIACGDVAVFPGDVLVGDREGVVVIPRHLADEVARDGAEQEQLEFLDPEGGQGGQGHLRAVPARRRDPRALPGLARKPARAADLKAPGPSQAAVGVCHGRLAGRAPGRSWMARLSSGTSARSVMP